MNTGRVALFPTCVVDAVAPQVGVAAVRVLRRLGYHVTVPGNATCCGQPAWNAGFAEDSARVARTTLGALTVEPVDTICVPAGSCATMIRVFWPELFTIDGDHDGAQKAKDLAPRIREFSELLTGKSEAIGGRLPARVAYHHSCRHMLRELRIHDEPVELLRGLEGCSLVEWSSDERCCGFGGLFSMKEPETSVAMADDKIDSLHEAKPDLLVGSDSSCLMHLEGRLRKRGDALPVKHLAEVLDESTRE